MIERIEINLLPAEYRIHRKQFRVKREFAYPVIVAGVAAVGFMFTGAYMQNSIRAYRNEIKAIQQAIEKNRPIQQEISRLQDDKKQVQMKIRALELIDVNREKWVRLMEEVSSRLPEYTWLTSMKEEAGPPPVIHLEGRTYSFPEVANLMSNLKDCPYISTVDLSQIEQADTKDRIYRFSISCAIDDNVYLPSGRMEKDVKNRGALQ